MNFDGNLNMVIVAVSLGMGMIPVAAPDFWHAFPTAVGTVMHSGISAAAVVAVVLNFLFNEITAGNRPDVSVFAAAPDERGNPVPKDD